jgi:hypothetical protein
MAMVRRVSLFERELRISLSASAIEILFELASVLSEGQIEDDGYFGSTMITIDLARVSSLVSDACDAATARRITLLLSSDRRAHERAREIARSEAVARAGRELARIQIDLRVRSSGAHLHMDLDVGASLGGPS